MLVSLLHVAFFLLDIPVSAPFSEIPNPAPLKSLANQFRLSKFSVPHLYMSAQVNVDELLQVQQKFAGMCSCLIG